MRTDSKETDPARHRLGVLPNDNAMLLPKGGVTWKSARSRIPPYRVIRQNVTRSRVLACLALTAVVVVLWGGISTSSREMQK